MAEELQHLLRKINDDYLKKAEAEKDDILGKAREEAAKLVADAEREAAAIVEKGRKEAENFRRRAEAAAGQAARDVVLALRSELESRLRKSIGKAAGEALTPQFMAEIIKELARHYGDSRDGVAILAGRRDADQLREVVKSTLAASFKADPAVFPNAGIKSGMQVSFNGGEEYFDFSDAAVSELLESYLGGELAKLFRADDAENGGQ